MTNIEKDTLINHLADSQTALLHSLENVADSQLQLVPAENQWSLGQIVEHIILVEKGIVKRLQSLATKPPSDTVATQIDYKELIGLLTVRDRKATSPEPFIPKGIFATTKDAIMGFNAHRNEIDNFIRTTTVPLNTIVFPHFLLGPLNGKTWMAFLAGHCLRHVEQMKEVKSAWKENK